MDDLLAALDAAAALYRSDEKASAPEPKKPWMSRPLPWVMMEPVVTAMEAVPEIHALTRIRQLSLGSSESKPLYNLLLASALVKRTAALGRAAAAVQELLYLVEENSSHARIVMVLAGVETPAPVELTPGVTLVPFHELEPPSWMEEFAERRLWPLSRSFDPVAPSAALTMRVPFSPAFTSEEQVEGGFPEQEVTLLRTVAHCIALAAGRPTAIVKVWYEDDDPRLPLITSGVSYSDPRWGSGAAAPYTVDADRVRGLVSSYQRFQGARGVLDIALDRLTSAWSGWHREERSIDLGIALEAVLMYTPDRHSGDNNEIRYKLGMRAAWLLGDTPEQRVEVFRQVRRLYDYRSQAAHSGQVNTKPATWHALDEEIEAGIALAGQIVAAVLAQGAWPQWDELVLGRVSR